MTVRRTFEELRALHGDEIAMLIAEWGKELREKPSSRPASATGTSGLRAIRGYRDRDCTGIKTDRRSGSGPTTGGTCRCIATACPFVQTSRWRSG